MGVAWCRGIDKPVSRVPYANDGKKDRAHRLVFNNPAAAPRRTAADTSKQVIWKYTQISIQMYKEIPNRTRRLTLL